MNDDDDIDTSDIPDFAPVSQWAKGPPQLITDISQLRDILVPTITRDTLINQLWLEVINFRGRNPLAKIKAIELIADLKGYRESTTDVVEENTDNLTEDEIRAVRDEFERSY